MAEGWEGLFYIRRDGSLIAALKLTGTGDRAPEVISYLHLT
jgi:hypothetical protein